MASLARLLDLLLPLGPVEATSGFDSRLQSVVIRIADSATLVQRDAINTALAGFDWNQAAEDAWLSTQAKAGAVEAFTTTPVLKAIMLAVLDELNILRGAAGLSLRTPEQVRTAIFNKIESGDAEALKL